MAQDRTDGQNYPVLNKYKRVPEGERVLISLPIKGAGKGNTGTAILSLMKEGTANFLGLKPADSLVRGKGKSYLRGAKGTKSYVLLLGKRQTIGGAEVENLSIPVTGGVGLNEFYIWAKTLTGKGVVGIKTPAGRQYRFKIDLSDDK